MHSRGKYGEAVCETILRRCNPKIEAETGLDLFRVNSYIREYYHAAILKAHLDRAAIEWSLLVALELEGDPWPIHFEGHGSVSLTPGQCVMAPTGKVKHWRDPFAGERYLTLFLHWHTQVKYFLNQGGNDVSLEDEDYFSQIDLS